MNTELQKLNAAITAAFTARFPLSPVTITHDSARELIHVDINSDLLYTCEIGSDDDDMVFTSHDDPTDTLTIEIPGA